MSACVLRNSATAFVTVDLTGDDSPTNRANNVACSGNQLKKQKKNQEMKIRDTLFGYNKVEEIYKTF